MTLNLARCETTLPDATATTLLRARSSRTGPGSLDPPWTRPPHTAGGWRGDMPRSPSFDPTRIGAAQSERCSGTTKPACPWRLRPPQPSWIGWSPVRRCWRCHPPSSGTSCTGLGPDPSGRTLTPLLANMVGGRCRPPATPTGDTLPKGGVSRVMIVHGEQTSTPPGVKDEDEIRYCGTDVRLLPRGSRLGTLAPADWGVPLSRVLG